jgi:hypothetical protein
MVSGSESVWLLDGTDARNDRVAGGLLFTAELLEHAVNITPTGVKEGFLHATYFSDDVVVCLDV